MYELSKIRKYYLYRFCSDDQTWVSSEMNSNDEKTKLFLFYLFADDFDRTNKTI